MSPSPRVRAGFVATTGLVATVGLVATLVTALVLGGVVALGVGPAAAVTPGPSSPGPSSPGPSSPGPSASPSPGSLVVVAGGPDVASAVSFVAQDFAARSEGFGYAEASPDGAVVDTGGRDFRLASDVLFAFDKAALTGRARTELARIATKLKGASVGAKPVTAVRITGYTDAVGGDGYNLRLSRRRAEAVRVVLAEALGAGIRVTSAGRGEAAPIAGNDTSSGRKANRRVEIRAV